MRVKFRKKIYYIEGLLPDPESGLSYITMPVTQGEVSN
jgi:hypothetical protein